MTKGNGSAGRQRARGLISDGRLPVPAMAGGNGGQRWQKPGSVTLNRNEWAVAAYGAPAAHPIGH